MNRIKKCGRLALLILAVGQTSAAGLRRVVTVLGGTLEGASSAAPLKGKILPGADYQIIRPDGFTEIDALLPHRHLH